MNNSMKQKVKSRKCNLGLSFGLQIHHLNIIFEKDKFFTNFKIYARCSIRFAEFRNIFINNMHFQL